MTWINNDPECGPYVDDFGGTYVNERTGLTLAQEFPDHYYECPLWAAWLLKATARLHGITCGFVSRWERRTQSPEQGKE